MKMELHNNECERSEDIVAYMYGELDVRAAERFESHLEACTRCVDEFAVVADPRFSVREWRQADFDHLATPAISIPYAAQESNWLETLKSAFQLPALIPVLGAVLLLIGVGMFYLRSGLPVAVAVNEPEPTRTEAMPIVAGNTPTDYLPSAVEPVVAGRSVPVVARRASYRPSQQKQLRRPASNEADTAAKEVRQRPSTVVAKKPALSSFDEYDDGSLRLADLIGEEGGV